MKVAAPAPNQKVIVNVGMENIKGLFLPSDVTVQAHGNNLILLFANNGKIIFSGLLPKLLAKKVSLRFADDSTLEGPVPPAGMNPSRTHTGKTEEQRRREEFLASVHPVQRNFITPPSFGNSIFPFDTMALSPFDPKEVNDAAESLKEGSILPGLPFFFPLLDFTEDTLPGLPAFPDEQDVPGSSRHEPAPVAPPSFPSFAGSAPLSSLPRKDFLAAFVHMHLSSAYALADGRTLALHPPQETLAWQRLLPFRQQEPIPHPDSVNGTVNLSSLALHEIEGELDEFPPTITYIGDEASYKNILGYYTIDAVGTLKNVRFLWFNASGADQEKTYEAWRGAGVDEKKCAAIRTLCAGHGGQGQLIAGLSKASLDLVTPGERFGVFLVPNGYAPYASLFAGKEPASFNGHLFFVVGTDENAPGRPATIYDRAPVLVYKEENSTPIASWTGAFHTAATAGDGCTPATLALNNDGLQHVLAGGVSTHGLEDSGLHHLGVQAEDLLIGFEDQPGGGSKKYASLVIRLHVPAATKKMIGIADLAPLVALSSPDKNAELSGATVTAHALNGAQVTFLGYDPEAATGLIPGLCVHYAVTGFDTNGDQKNDTVTIHFTGIAGIATYQSLLRSVRFVCQPGGTPVAEGLRSLDYSLIEADGFPGARGRAFVLFRHQTGATNIASDVPEPILYQGSAAHSAFGAPTRESSPQERVYTLQGEGNASMYAELATLWQKAHTSQQAFDAAAIALYGGPWELLSTSYYELTHTSAKLLETVQGSEDLQARTHAAYTLAQAEYTNIAPCIAHAQTAYHAYVQARTGCLQCYTQVQQAAAGFATAMQEVTTADPAHPLVRGASAAVAQAASDLYTTRSTFEDEHRTLDALHTDAMASIHILEEKVQGAEAAHSLMASAFTGFQQDLATAQTLYIALAASIHTLQARYAAADVAYAAAEVVPTDENLAILARSRALLTAAQQEYQAALHAYSTADRALQDGRAFLSQSYDCFREAHAEQHATHTATLEAMTHCQQTPLHTDGGAETPGGTTAVAAMTAALAQAEHALGCLAPDIQDIATACGIEEHKRQLHTAIAAYAPLEGHSLATLRLYADQTGAGAFNQLQQQLAIFADVNAAYSTLSHELSDLLLEPINAYSLVAERYTAALAAFEIAALELGFTSLSQAASAAYEEYNALHVAYLKAQGIAVAPGTSEHVLVIDTQPTDATLGPAAPLFGTAPTPSEPALNVAADACILLSRDGDTENIVLTLDEDTLTYVPKFAPETDVLDLTPLIVQTEANNLPLHARFEEGIHVIPLPDNTHDALVSVGEFRIVLGNALAHHSPEELHKLLVAQQVNLLILP